MAKECNRQKLILDIDNFVNYIYSTGIVQSTIIHTAILLFMAIVTLSTVDTKPIVLTLKFDDSPIENIDHETLDTIDLASINESIDNAIEDTESSLIEDVSVQEDVSSPTENIVLEDLEQQTASYTSLAPSLKVINESLSIETEEQEDSEQIAEDEIKPIVESKPRKQPRITKNTNHNQRVQNKPRGGVFGDFDKFGDVSAAHSGMQGNSTDNGPVVNPMSGPQGEINRRLRMAGAKSGDVQVSIAWNTIDDIDLHVTFYSKKFNAESRISWINRMGVCGGCLDVDRNAELISLTNQPVENVFWPKGRSPDGEYTVFLHHFRNWSAKKSVNVVVMIKVFDKVKTIRVNLPAYGPIVEVITFSKDSF